MPFDKANRPKLQIITPPEPALNLAPPPSNLPRSTQFRVGEKIIDIDPDNVKTVKHLGQGAYGYVDLIEHEPSGIKLAVKRIAYSGSKLNDQDRLLRDMEVLIKSKGCPNIVEFYGAIYWEDNLYLFMEILDASLDKFYRLAYQMHPDAAEDFIVIPESVLGKIASSVVQALHYLHTLKVIHRDVKPSNILINRNGQVKLCDFGISGYLVNSVAKTFEAGCQAYMAPERLMSNPKGYDIRSDVWSLGLTMFEIATGKFPYPVDPRNIFKQIKAVYEDPPPKLPENRFSPICHDFISKCLEKDHHERPNYVQLLEYEFIKTYQDSDIIEFVAKVLDTDRS